MAAWYAILCGSLLALLVFYRLSLLFQPSGLRTWLHHHLLQPILFANVTRSQALLLLIYIIVNVLVLVFPIRSQIELGRRAALVSTLNLVPLFLGGRTNPFVDLIGIPLHTYHFWHFWVGRVAVSQALIHAGVMLARRSSKKDALIITGWVVSCAIWLEGVCKKRLTSFSRSFLYLSLSWFYLPLWSETGLTRCISSCILYWL